MALKVSQGMQVAFAETAVDGSMLWHTCSVLSFWNDCSYQTVFKHAAWRFNGPPSMQILSRNGFPADWCRLAPEICTSAAIAMLNYTFVHPEEHLATSCPTLPASTAAGLGATGQNQGIRESWMLMRSWVMGQPLCAQNPADQGSA